MFQLYEDLMKLQDIDLLEEYRLTSPKPKSRTGSPRLPYPTEGTVCL